MVKHLPKWHNMLGLISGKGMKEGRDIRNLIISMGDRGEDRGFVEGKLGRQITFEM